ncbi:MAG: hypothetical protein FJY53_03055 [Betaproteobacteria bacterium]|nr:hypothetical protein [Betaproteobacteria bacterium]
MIAHKREDHGRKLFVLCVSGVILAVLAMALPRIPQPAAYHDFADQSVCMGVPHCFDIASNLLFIMAGMAGMFFLSGTAEQRAFIDVRESLPYRLFFLATILVGLGSGFYHLAPDNDRLMWDRAAVSLALMSWFAAILCERVSLRAGLSMLPLLLAAGLASVFYWGWSERQGMGDLRLYGLMQIIPILQIPLLLRLYPPRYSGDKDILSVIALYAVALLFDLSDHQVYNSTRGIVSGHTLKHVIAALAAYWVLVRLRRRTARE